MSKRIYKLRKIKVTRHKRTSILTTPCPAGKECMVASSECNQCESRADAQRINVKHVFCSKVIRKPPATLYSNPFSGGE